MLSVQSLQAQLAQLPPDTPVEVAVGRDRVPAQAAASEPAANDRPARVVVTAGGGQSARALGRILSALFRDGPDTAWSPDTLDEVADALRDAGLAPDGVVTQREREADWGPASRPS